jgi:hypothetical protein
MSTFALRPWSCDQEVDDLLADLVEAADAAAVVVSLGKERWDAERPLRLAGEAIIGRLGDIATKLPDEITKATPDVELRIEGYFIGRSCFAVRMLDLSFAVT